VTEDTRSPASVSVVICTYNRAELLPRLLRTVARELEGTQSELVVVDNASTDSTQDVLAELCASIPDLLVVVEPTPGLSRARNTGVSRSTGEIVLFLDDDAVPQPGWVEQHLSPYRNDAAGDVAAVGGRIELLFEVEARPAWLSSRFDAMLGAYDLGDEERPYDDGLSTPPGGNMSFRRAALDDVGAFDPSLGRLGDVLAAGEEFELMHRMFRRGWRAVYNPRALVLHVVPPERLRPRYFRSRLLENWRSSERLGQFDEVPRWRSVRSVVRSAAYDAARTVTARSTADRVYHLLRVEAHLRYLASAARPHRRAAT
jgi:glycosyltransferase involved in cell wall biosynthesis